MQLFITSNIEKKGKQLFLKNVPELLSQIRKVLRGKIGDTIAVQNREGTIMRYTIQISDWNDKDLIGEILEEKQLTHPGENQQNTNHLGGDLGLAMLIAMPNKWDKAELIVQKLSEIGVQEIYFRPAERSIIKQWNPKKAERLIKIAQEATEQSRGIQIPNINWCENVKNICEGKKVVVFDIPRHSDSEQGKEEKSSQLSKIATSLRSSQGQLGIVGPEGGLTKKDYQLLGEYEIIGLGDSVLRMETAAIVGSWILKNR